MRSRRGLALLLLAPLVGPLLASGPAGAAPSAHRPAVVDTLFPQLGDPSIDVDHYGLRLRYDPHTNHLTARAALTITPRHALRRFTLDLHGLDVGRVLVDGLPAKSARSGDHLVITASRRLTSRFVVRIGYQGTPGEITDTDGSTEGWVRTADGAIGLGEPMGTMAWVPSNNTPGDKATWSYDVAVPRGYQVAANGLLARRSRAGHRVVWHWREREPMATYLATVGVGHYRMRHGHVRSIDGRRIDVRDFVDPTTGASAQAERQLPAVLRFEERRFGPYPFSSTGLIVDDADVGYALETQTRPFYPGSASALVHETAHQWYGDSLTLSDWHDIWLAEGFATYAEWLWDAAHGGKTPAQRFADTYATPAGDDLWRPSPRGFTDSADLFGSPVYTRGALTLEALRRRIGDAAFFRLLPAWAAAHRHGTVTTAQFVALAERISGRPLDRFFAVWLDRAGKPPARFTH